MSARCFFLGLGMLGVLPLLAGCYTPATAAPPAPGTLRPDAWTTPRDWNERSAGRLVRTPDVRVTQAPEPELGVEVELAFLSKYVW
ncbi:MAG: hypothetical protein QNJ90_11580, partial [Planctomycetota bacterium]|nr:hypothetical protein [Planctomycetota bacterium]